MPLIIPKTLPAYGVLGSENVFVMHKRRARTQHIRPLRIVALNLMPTKIATETQLARLLANSPLQVQLTLLHTASHAASHVPGEHMEAFYKTFDEIRGERFDGMIITGAPVEQLAFEEVDYWDELVGIMDYAKKHVHATLYICWGAQAGLYHHYGIPKYGLPRKLSGIFSHTINDPTNQLFRGFDDVFHAPHSRHTEVRGEDIAKIPTLEILAESDEAGVLVAGTLDGRSMFITGHLEYDRDTLDAEYRRDVAKGMEIAPPAHYYPGDDATRPPLVSWRAHAHLFYSNWLNYCVYQATPYRLDDIPTDRD